MAELFRVADVQDIPPGTGRQVEADGRALAVFNVGGTFYCVDGTCPHRGGPLGEGELEGETVSCPFHAWQFELTTGEHVFNRNIKLRCYPVRLVDGAVHVEIEPEIEPEG